MIAFQTLIQYIRSVEWTNRTGAYIDGVWTEAADVPVAIQLATLQISAKTLKTFDPGKYSTKDRVFYQIGEANVIHEGDFLKYNLEKFEVREILNRIEEGGFIKYIGVKINE